MLNLFFLIFSLFLGGMLSNAFAATPPSISTAFGAASIPLDGTTSLTFTITNPNATEISGISFTDSLPAGLVVADPNGLVNTCGGTVTADAGSGSIDLSGGTLAANSSGTVTINVQGSLNGTKVNNVAVSSTDGTGNTSSASLNVLAPPVIATSFLPASIGLNETSVLRLTITYPAGNPVPLTDVAFIDTLPAGLTVPNESLPVLGGTLTLTAPNTISLSGVTLTSPILIEINVTATTAGNFTNTTSAISSANGGTGNSATASLAVNPLTIAAAFDPPSIPLNGTTSLVFTITNPYATALTGISFTDNLPAGLVVAPVPNLSNTCGGTVNAVSGSGSFSLTGGTLAAHSSGTITVNVQGTSTGVKNNSVTVSSNEHGTGNTASASLTVVALPTVSTAFGAASIPLDGTIPLTFTITNPYSQTINNIAFTDNLPAGLVVAAPNGLTNTCGGTVTATAGSGSISLTGGTLAGNSSGTVTVNVQGISGGIKNNSVTVSANSVAGNTSNASLTVVSPPVISTAFSAASIPYHGTTALSFTITNPNATALTGISFTDSLPAGLVVADPNGLTNTCGGTVTAAAGSGTISLSGGTLAANSSGTITVNVKGSSDGIKNNSVTVSSTNGGAGNTSSTSLTVLARTHSSSGSAKTNTPFVLINDAGNVSENSAVLNGEITVGGSSDVTEYGFLWGTSSSSLSNKVKAGTDNKRGSFTAAIDNLAPGTPYYFQVYAVNAQGTSYSSILSFTTKQQASPAAKTVLRFYIGKTDYYVNDQKQSMDTAPIIVNGRSLLPVSYVASPLGAAAAWNNAEQKVTITGKDTAVELWIGRNMAKVNGIAAAIDPNNAQVTPILVPPGRTMLPLAFTAQSLGCKVEWDQAQQMITVSCP